MGSAAKSSQDSSASPGLPDPVRRSKILAAAVIALGALLMAPSLWGGFLLDDFVYLLHLEGRIPVQAPGSPLFELIPHSPDTMEAWVREGMLPWWAGDDVYFYFFRPLSAALMRLDHGLFGRWAPGYHFHSLLWWALLLLAAWLVLRRTLSGGTAVLALLLFAVDESHVLPATWIANRNALVGIAPVLLGLWAHLRWREEGWRPGQPLALALYAAGLLGGEAAIGTMAYPAFYELFGRDRPWPARLRGLLPLMLLGLAYIAVYKRLGCGAGGSALYLDPTVEPLAWARAALTRVPTLLSGALAGLSADLWLFVPAWRDALVVTGLAAAVTTGLLLRASWPRDDARARRHLRWLLPASAASLLPAAATFPSDRLSLAASLGLAALLATILAAGRQSLRSGRRRWLTVGAGLVFLLHLVLAPLAGIGLLVSLRGLEREGREAARQAELGPPPETFDAVVLWAPDHIVGIYIPLQLEPDGVARLRSWRPLSLAPYDHRINRVDGETLELEVVGGSMMTSLFEQLYRAADQPLTPGEVVDGGLLRAEILSAGASGPTRVRFRFRRSLDDPSLRLLVWRDGRLRAIPPPDIGETITVRREAGPSGL